MRKIALSIISLLFISGVTLAFFYNVSNKESQMNKIFFLNEEHESIFRQVIGKPKGQLNIEDAFKGYQYFRNIFMSNSPYRINRDTGEITNTDEMSKVYVSFLNKKNFTFKFLEGLVNYYNESIGENLTVDEIYRAMISMEIIEEDEKVEKFNEWCNTQEDDRNLSNRDYYMEEIYPYEERD